MFHFTFPRVLSDQTIQTEKETAMNSNTDANATTNAELERQKNAFIEKLIEIVRKQEKPLVPDKPKEQDQT